MKRSRIFIVLAIALVVGAMNAQAQNRGRNHRENGREMVMRSNGEFHMRGNNDTYRDKQHRNVRPQRHHDKRYGQPRPHLHQKTVHHVVHHPRVDHRGYLPGWGGRVRYHGGRWGYHRNNRWYWYDCYFAPDYYFAHPVAHFHAHISPVAAGVVGGAVLGAFIGALCR